MEETLKEIERYLEVTYPDDWFLPGKLDILRLKFLSELKQQKIDVNGVNLICLIGYQKTIIVC